MSQHIHFALIHILHFAGTIRVSILCDTIRRDVLGDENIRATAFNIEQEQQQQFPSITSKQPDDDSKGDNGGGGPQQQDGILNQQDPNNDFTMPAPIERSLE